MPKTTYIELGSGEQFHILFEDRSVLAIDKPAGWMLVPFSWQQTKKNLQAAITSSIAERRFWARSRNLKYLQFIHRLDADTTGIILFAKSPGALRSISELFESRRMEKRYLAVVRGVPKQKEWSCQLALSPDEDQIGRIRADPRGKNAETHFRVLLPSTDQRFPRTLVEARPVTGRTHQIRVHLASSGHPVWGDVLYGPEADAPPRHPDLGLRAVELSYQDPFDHRRIRIRADEKKFCAAHGFAPAASVEK